MAKELPPDWSEWPLKRGYHPVSDALIGSPTEQTRHVVARVAFMNALLRDERVARLFEKWATPRSLYKLAGILASALDTLGTALGLEHRSRLPDVDLSDIADEEREQLSSLGVDVAHAEERLWRMVNKSEFKPSPSDFVRDELGLPWSWVAFELAESFYRNLYARAYGRNVTRHYWAEPKAPPVPHVELSFATGPSERVDEALQRLRVSYVQAEAQLLAAQREWESSGRAPKDKGKHIAEYAKWFYRVRLCGEPVTRIAREYNNAREHPRPVSECDDRHTIRRGINEAERLLGLTQYRLK